MVIKAASVRPDVYIPKHGEATPRNRTCQRVALLGSFIGGAILTSAISRSMSSRFLSLGMGGMVSVLCAILYAKIRRPFSENLCKYALYSGVMIGSISLFISRRALFLSLGGTLSLVSTVFYEKIKNIDRGNQLQQAIDEKDMPRFKSLLRMGLNPNTQDDRGDTALHRMIKPDEPNLELMELLIQGGADVNAQNKAGETPLDASIDFYREEIIGLLLDSGADPNIKDKNNRSPLERASEDLEFLKNTKEKNNQTLESLIEEVSLESGLKQKKIRGFRGISKLASDRVVTLGYGVNVLTDIVKMMKDWPHHKRIPAMTGIYSIQFN